MEVHLEKLVEELKELDHHLMLVDGKMIKPSQCFRYETDPLHYMFNTNCPEELKQKVQAIFKTHVPTYEDRTSQ